MDFWLLRPDTSEMPNAWDRPYSSKFKIGDPNPDPLFLAVGRALTKWEIVEAELGVLFAILTGARDVHYQPSVRAFGVVTGTVTRADMIAHAAEAFFENCPVLPETEYAELSSECSGLLKAYSGWAGRRNDIAHGCVTGSINPNHFSETVELNETFLLCPSHGSSKKWPMHWEPVYQYRADEVDVFAAGFDALCARVITFVDRLGDFA
jgi:hypothetical protein